MAAEELKRITRHITCPICLLTYNNPKVLPCQHSYCQECLTNIDKDHKIVCPECRKVTAVPNSGVKDFPTNLTITHLIDSLLLRRQDGGKVNCEICIETDPVTSFCFTCSIFMCLACQNHHKRSRDTHQHLVIDLEDRSQLIPTKPVQSKSALPSCPDHDLELKFYCDTCERLVCVYCTMNEHATHSHGALKAKAAKHREQLKITTSPLKDMDDKLSQAHNSISGIREKVLQQHKNVDRGIDQFLDSMIQNIEQQRQQLKQKLNSKVDGEVKLLTSQMQQIEGVQGYVTNAQRLADKVEKGCDDEMFLNEKKLVRHVNEVTEKFSQLQFDPVESYAFWFTPCNNDPLPQFGYFISPQPSQCDITKIPLNMLPRQRVQFTVITKDEKGMALTSGGGTVKAQLDDGRGNIQLVTTRDNNNGTYTGSFTTEFIGHHQLSVTIGGQNINNSPYSFVVARDYSKVIRSTKVIDDDGAMGWPWGVAFSNDNHWAVADYSNDCIYLFNKKDQLVRKFSSYEASCKAQSYPHGVSFDSNNFLYVVDGGNHRVQKFDPNGKFVMQFGGEGASDGQLRRPVGIAIHHDNVYIADRDNHRISVFKTDGTYSFSFGSEGNGPKQFKYPWDVAVTPDKTLLVVDSWGHCIQSFQLDGTFIHKFGTQGVGKGEMDSPSSLTVDPNGFILVTESNNNRVSLFDKNYNFVHSFGNKGTGVNQFNGPCGIAISPNGSIYVSDTANKRLVAYQ